MRRRTFLESSFAAATLGATPIRASSAGIVTSHVTQASLFAALTRPTSGAWVRYIMGAGVSYQKQIGTATEIAERGQLIYLETQVGTPGGSCNPNTMKRTYLAAKAFPSLVDRTRVVANVANSGTTLTRWADLSGGQTVLAQDATLQLLDAAYLYDDRPLRVVASTKAMLEVPGALAYAGSEDSRAGKPRAIATRHIVAEFHPSDDAKHRLTKIELWTTPDVPFGVVKYRAYARDLDPFELRLYAYGTRFKTDLAMSLETIRSITPSGTYVQTN